MAVFARSGASDPLFATMDDTPIRDVLLAETFRSHLNAAGVMTAPELFAKARR